MTENPMDLESLVATDLSTLHAERLQLHHGAWLLASVAHAVLDHRDDDSHANLGVVRGGAGLATHPLDAAGGSRLELALESLELVMIASEEQRFSLCGRSMDDALSWAATVLEQAGSFAGSVPRREFPDFPDSPLATGAPFETGDARARRTLGGWFGFADALASEVLGPLGFGSQRVWPHHFDLGALLTRGTDRGVGCGLSPGDDHFDEPYFYVYGWPMPDLVEEPTLRSPIGSWNTTGFTGALLRASELRDVGLRKQAVADFLQGAVALCAELSAG